MKSFRNLIGGVLLSTVAVSAVLASSNTNEESKALNALFADERETYYQENPGTAPKGQPRIISKRFQSLGQADRARRQGNNAKLLERLNQISKDDLSDAERLNHAMFEFMVDGRLLFEKHRTWRIPFVSDSGFHTYPTSSWRGDTFRTADDYRAYIERMSDLPRYLNDNIEGMKTGLADGWTMPQVVLDGLMPSFENLANASVEEINFYTPFKSMADAVSAEEQDKLREEAKAVIKGQVIPAYKALYAFMKNEYYPNARTSLGATELPGGEEFYADMVRYYTTLDVSPDEVHELGLKEVARIRSEMEDIIKEVKFEGSFKDFLAFLRSDPQFYAKTEKELLMHASYIAKLIDGRMPSLFGKLPRQPYGVEAVPASIAPNYTTGRYVGAPAGAPRGGYYWVNTYALDKRPLYVLPALTLHEGVPGHHHQVALSNELEGVPEFRLGLYPHAFGEGWGLYSEKLGLELGVYQTPYEQFGRLTYEMWRACRLVIDTGIHAKGWTRDQAIKLLEENSALSTHNIRTEVDRYISWPGQALAYKMGELTFLRLRAEAKEALGDKFDVRAFHDTVLSVGGVPMDLLEELVDEWVKQQQEEGK